MDSPAGDAMATIPLPPMLAGKLDALAVEVRRLRLLRGVSLFAVLLFAIPVLAIALDVALNASGWQRGLLLAGWLTAMVLAFWFLVVLRLRRDVPKGELARAIEQHFPNMAERLQTLVELSEHVDAGNGSKAMMAVLAHDTIQRTKKLNFAKVAPTAFSLRLAVVAAACGLLALSPLLLVRGTTERVRRLVLPWYAPPVDVPYALKVSSQHLVVKRNEPVTLSAYLERIKPTGELPERLTLAYRAVGSTEETRLPMSGDDKAAFTLTRPTVPGGFEYRVESDAVQSDWYAVSVVDPVLLSSGSSVVVPPKYAVKRTVVSKDSLSEIEGLQHSTASLTAKLDRKPTDVHVEWRPGDGKAELGILNLTPTLRYTDDRHTVTVQTPLPTDGTIRFSFFGEKALRTDLTVAVRATPDAPPRFDRVAGVPGELRDVKPDGQLAFDLAVSDDVAVGAVYLDFAPQQAPLDRFSSELLPMPVGENVCEAKLLIDLAGKVKLGETLRIRLRAVDTRSLPEFNLTPNETVYPPTGWATLKGVANARPLIEQDILAQKENVARNLEEITKRLGTTQKQLEEIRSKTKGTAKLNAEQAGAILDAREQVKTSAHRLHELADDAGRNPDLLPLARIARELADQPLAATEEELRKAGTNPDAGARETSLERAKANLDDVLERLQGLKKNNEDRANLRLDRARLEELSAEQKALADSAKTADAAKLKTFEERQQALNDRLRQLRDSSDALKAAAAEAEKQQTEELASNLKALADQHRELDDAILKSREQAKRETLEGLQNRQRALKDAATKLGQHTERSAPLADAKPLDRQALDKAEELLRKGQPADALIEQEQAARELDRLAGELAKAATERRESRAAASQIARWQRDLNRRIAEALKQSPSGLAKAEQDSRIAEQAAIQKTIDRLTLPRSDSLGLLKTDASNKAKEAIQELRRSPTQAEPALKAEAEALERLAEKIPTNKQRLDAAKIELDTLSREQDRIAKEAQSAADAVKANVDDAGVRKELARTLAEAAKKQEELERKLRNLDTPGSESRRERTAEASQRATEDLRAGLSQDIGTSQGEARRQLDRLKESLDGRMPADEKASELARLQRDLTRNLTKTLKPEEVQRLQRQQGEIAQELSQLKAPEAPGQLADAQQGVREAERAGQQQEPNSDELQKKRDAASNALELLADRLNAETPARRLERLAGNREREADRAKQQETDRPDLARSSDARRAAERDLKELHDTRTGDAQVAKSQLQAALEKLQRADEPDRDKYLQKQAADAARQLADAVKSKTKANAKSNNQLVKEPDTDPADENDPGNALPSRQAADQARELARHQRELRKDVASAAERAAKGDRPKPGSSDPLETIAKEQDELQKQLQKLNRQAQERGDDAAEKASSEAATSARQTQEALRAGDAEKARAHARQAARQLHDTARAVRDADVQQQAETLAEHEENLSTKAGATDADDARKRQANRIGELSAASEQLAKTIDEAVRNTERPNPVVSQREKAAEGAREAAKTMQQAGRDGLNGRLTESDRGRRDAELKLDDASRTVRGTNKQPEATGKPNTQARAAAENVQQASRDMMRADDQLKQGQGPAAAQSGQAAAERLAQSARQLGTPSEGSSTNPPAAKPGTSGTGSTPGQGSTGNSGTVPSIVVENLGKPWGELPGDVKSKILVELKAKYGEDYARIIKLYFEQLADRK